MLLATGLGSFANTAGISRVRNFPATLIDYDNTWYRKKHTRGATWAWAGEMVRLAVVGVTFSQNEPQRVFFNFLKI